MLCFLGFKKGRKKIRTKKIQNKNKNKEKEKVLGVILRVQQKMRRKSFFFFLMLLS